MGGNFSVSAIGAISNPILSVDFTDTIARQRASDSLKKLLSEMHMREKRVVVGIAESKVYSRVLSMPNMSDAELTTAITWEAEQFVPVPIVEVEMDYTVIRRPTGANGNNKMLVYLLAAPKKYLEQVVGFVTGVGLEPVAIESEMMAVARSATYGGSPGTSMLLHIGASSTIIAIVENEDLLFSYVVPIGGVAMTRALVQSLSFPFPQAEEYKRTYGLDGRQFEGKVKNALSIVVNGIVVEVRKALEYHAVSTGVPVSRILLSGGSAYLPELTTYISSEFPGVEVVVGNPFAKAKVGKQLILPNDKASYSVAVGLALREQ